MKPPVFDYTAARTVDEAVGLLAEHGDEAKLIAGGQSLMPMLSMRLARPTQLVDINEVTSLDGIERTDGALTVGAMTRERAVERSPLVAEHVPVLAEAVPLIGHVSIRNRGTIGGSLAHADAAAELPAVALLVDAELVVRSVRGERTVAAEDFFLGHYTTALDDDECLVAVRFPVTPPSAGSAIHEVVRRHGDYALAGAAAMVALGPDGAITEARLCLFGVAGHPLRMREVEASLAGATPGDEAFAAAAAAAIGDLDPPSDVHGSADYRRHVAGVAVRRALSIASARAGGPA